MGRMHGDRKDVRMSLAVPLTGFPLATWNGAPITLGEQVASKALGVQDVHFGRNWSPEREVPVTLRDYVDDEYREYGPRCMDIRHRGGTVSETNWELWVTEPITLLDNGFVDFFNEFNREKAPGNKTFTRSKSLKNESLDLKGLPKYGPDPQGRLSHKGQLAVDRISGQAHTLGYVDSPAQITRANREGAPLVASLTSQFGTRWSKTSLEWCIRKLRGTVHFHLEGMGDVHEIVKRGGAEYTYSVTARELRYVYRNWERFRTQTRFYNGYTRDGRAVEVLCPWDRRGAAVFLADRGLLAGDF